MSQKQVELDGFDVPEAPKVPETPISEVSPVKAPKPSDRLSKKVEVCEFARNSGFQQWADESKANDLFWTIPFPSKRFEGLLYDIQIDKETYIATCNCPSFIGGIDENGIPFAGKGFCSHTRLLRWICAKKKHNTIAISLAAKLNLSEEWLDDKKVQILEAVKRKSMTCDELEVELHLKHQTCSPIILSLVKIGFLEDSGDTRPTRSGIKYQAIVWQIP
jgi:hypothetical protein